MLAVMIAANADPTTGRADEQPTAMSSITVPTTPNGSAGNPADVHTKNMSDSRSHFMLLQSASGSGNSGGVSGGFEARIEPATAIFFLLGGATLLLRRRQGSVA